MIEWMQRHKKWLVITIWVSAIAFVAAGMVGWGQYDFSLSKDSVAKVGQIQISRLEFANAYQQAFEMQRAQQNDFDEAKAKEMNLDSQVLDSLIMKALIANYALDLGLRVTDKEVATEIQNNQNFEIFQKDGVFSRDLYDSFLKERGIKSSFFEESVRDELLMRKILVLLLPKLEMTSLEYDTFSATFGIYDDIDLEIIDGKSININPKDEELKEFWEKIKQNYKTPTTYKVSMILTKASEQPYTQDELQDYYNANKSQYIDEQGDIASLDSIKLQVIADLQNKKAKDKSLKDFIQFKKQTPQNAKEVTITQDSSQYTQEILESLQNTPVGNVVKKPMPLGDDYISLKLLDKQNPRIMEFEEVKSIILRDYRNNQLQIELNKIAESKLSTFKGQRISNISINPNGLPKVGNLDPYTSQILLQSIFTSTKSTNYAIIGDSAFLYRIKSQSIKPSAQDQFLNSIIPQHRAMLFESFVIGFLQKQYNIKKYI